MKKYLITILTISLLMNYNGIAQSRGIRIGYIDMEYILEKVPSYAEAKNQLDQKAEKWKQEIETKKSDINKLKEALKTERVLLTKELIEEREEEIAFQENELLQYTQKRFGPNGDLIVQKTVLIKPIQDQVFNAVQDIAEAKKYDYIFDKSSDLTMLFAAKKHDISDKVVNVLTRAEKREQMSKKQQRLEEEKERKQELIDDNPELSERQKKSEERKAARLQMIEDKKLAAEEKRKEAEENRKKLLEEKNAKKNGTVSDKSNSETSGGTSTVKGTETTPTVDKKAEAEAAKKKSQEDRQKQIEDRKKAAEEKRQKAISDREAAKKAREEAKSKP
ncbi:OmpH family outer membrane protein [Flavobacterium aciduliphilum]|uniref:Periplasmic chaperone for outer membrane proteins Skp n=1 Tax=Flavobacterium aciduliphilum TaxID=1101402 RepID=A0A328YCN2_9FLAO|nr:OmpH family outer membrane protein [Flavobacterium aciduliphilum]RAR71791.1 periplasmic chaperone for outer membrane proteins Skp [Flavobacterium aciduliphilum]